MNENESRIAIIGAGLAGLIAATKLVDSGCAVTLFDKGRGVAGRMSTRRGDEGHAFDHGAQYYTVREPAFAEVVNQWETSGVTAIWHGKIVSIECGGGLPGKIEAVSEETQRWVGVPGMSAICKQLAKELVATPDDKCRIESGVRVGRVEATADEWQLLDDQGEALGKFSKVLVTTPAPQAAELLSVDSSLAAKAAGVQMHGCWAVLLSLDERLPVAFDGAFVNDSSVSHGAALSWVARNNSKPGRSDSESWVLHGSHAWSEQNLELSDYDAASLLLSSFRDITGCETLEPVDCAAHRWRYAGPVEPNPGRCLQSEAGTLFAAGDWCGGPRVEGAYLSGFAAAEAILERSV